VQWIADQNPTAGLIPSAGKPERYRVQEWLNFVTSELHKVYAPLFRPTTPDAFKDISKENLGKRFDWIDKQLAGKQYLMGDKFTVADAYLFTVLRWSGRVNIDLSKWTKHRGLHGPRPGAAEGAGGDEAEGWCSSFRAHGVLNAAAGPGSCSFICEIYGPIPGAEP